MSNLSRSSPRGRIVAACCLAQAVAGCSGYDPNDDGPTGLYEQDIRGGTVIAGAIGVVDLSVGCTGSMIAPNVVLTAAHCFKGLGAPAMKDGSATFVIRYYDPDGGLRTVWDGPASWHVLPTYQVGLGASGANSDVGIVTVPGRFENTDYHDYLRTYSDLGSHLYANLVAYGAGFYSYSGSQDDNLRTTWFEVESVANDHIVIDNRTSVSVCKGDSGGPLMFSVSLAGKSVPTVTGMLSNSNVDYGVEGELCANNDAWHDDAYYARTNWDHMQWVEDQGDLSCDLFTAANRDYRRCFELPLIEDVTGEGRELGEGVAIATAFL